MTQVWIVFEYGNGVRDVFASKEQADRFTENRDRRGDGRSYVVRAWKLRGGSTKEGTR